MMRSLSSAVAGLRTHQTKMDVIGNNIANVNTYGFKASRATFADVYYQSLSGAAGPGTTTGGTNPTQIGYGASVATIDVLNTQSGRASTDRALDVYISGDGFLVTQDAAGTYLYTRLGNLGFDADGNLIDGNGNYVLGFPQNSDGTPQIPANGIATGDSLQPIKVSPELLDQLTGISISTSGEIVGTLPGGSKITISSALPSFVQKGTETINDSSVLSGSIKLNMGGYLTQAKFDALGLKAGTADVKATKISFGDIAVDPGSLEVKVVDGVMTVIGQYTEEGKDPVAVTASGSLKNGEIVLKDGNGNVLFTIETNYDGKSSLNATDPATPLTTTTELRYQLTGTDKGGNVVTNLDGNGEPLVVTGTMTKLTLADFEVGFDPSQLTYDDNGTTKVKASFAGAIGRAGLEEGEKLNIGALVLAKFRNAAGLEQAGTSNFMETANSGEAVYVKPGVEGTGKTVANSLEMSNVDISKEFTDMITTQRGFQANTRIVTVSDEMLQELVNLKR